MSKEEGKQAPAKNLPTIKFGEGEKEVRIPFQAENLRATLEDFEANLDTATAKKLADAAKLEATPFHIKLLKPVLIGVVQNAWFQEVRGKVPAECETNQKQRVGTYRKLLDQLKSGDSEDMVAGSIFSKPKKASTSEGGERAANVYRLTEAGREKWSKFKGQQRLMVRAMEQLDAGPDGKGCTVKNISDTVRDTEETKAPSDKNCAFHVNAWGHDGIVEKKQEDGSWGPAHEKKASKSKGKKKQEETASAE